MPAASTSPTSSDPAVVRIGSPGDVVCAVEQMLGFVPQRSLVVVCLHGPRRRLGLAMRFDLDVGPDTARDADGSTALGDVVVARVRRERADGVLLLVYPADPVVGELPHRPLVERISGALDALVVDAVAVTDGRWRSYQCTDVRCCGPRGRPVDRDSAGATALRAAYALAGQSVLPDRPALVRSLSYAGTAADAARARPAADAMRRRLAAQSRAQRRRVAVELAARLADAAADPRVVLSREDALTFAVACADVGARDGVLLMATGDRRDPLRRALTAAVREVPAPVDAPLCAVLAWFAYCAGDGVVTSIAIERALTSDPQHSLARLLADALDRQMPPSVLEGVMQGASA